jgi:hypothetical protein
MRWVVILLVILAGWWGWKSVAGWYHHPSTSPAPVSGGSNTTIAKGGDYDLEHVDYLGRMGACLFTSAGAFAKDHMSQFGFVTGIDWFDNQPVVHCRSNTRREVFVLVQSPLRIVHEVSTTPPADRNSPSRTETSDRINPKPQVTPTPPTVIVAPITTPQPLAPGHLEKEPSTEMKFYNPQAPQINIIPVASPTP